MMRMEFRTEDFPDEAVEINHALAGDEQTVCRPAAHATELIRIDISQNNTASNETTLEGAESCWKGIRSSG